jgi:hypothetical protein
MDDSLCLTIKSPFRRFAAAQIVMKVVYPFCCGIDVHKSFLVATMIKTTSGTEPSYQKKIPPSGRRNQHHHRQPEMG